MGYLLPRGNRGKGELWLEIVQIRLSWQGSGTLPVLRGQFGCFSWPGGPCPVPALCSSGCGVTRAGTELWEYKNLARDGQEGVCLPLSNCSPSCQSSLNVQLVKLTTSRFFNPKSVLEICSPNEFLPLGCLCWLWAGLLLQSCSGLPAKVILQRLQSTGAITGRIFRRKMLCFVTRAVSGPCHRGGSCPFRQGTRDSTFGFL